MNSKYILKDFLTKNDIEQVIIPEIQRDYVWEKENVEKLLNTIYEKSIKQNENMQGIIDENLNAISPEMREALTRTLKENAQICNVGFIYAYTDPEIADRRILIDGQQRITTLFLLLLFLSVKEGKQGRFENSYFTNQMLKIDYKVRESAHEFMLRFVYFILNDNDIEDVKNQYWYFSEYNSDITIQHLIANYDVIKRYCEGKKLSLDYVENYIEFWCFDTNKSEQGEELYIYMNSRGESVSSSENIKAELLKKLSDNEKDLWGEKWEDWQNFFWHNRGNKPNADTGIACFLRIISIIECVKKYNEKSVEKLAEEIKTIEEQKSIKKSYLNFEIIESYFSAFNTLRSTKEIHWNNEWLSEKADMIQYFILFPAVMYIMKHQQFQHIDLKRFVHFFYNLTKFDNLTKQPYNTVINIIRITNAFLEAGYTDIVDLIMFKDNYKTILPDEEIIKLSIYKSKDNAERNEIEELFWKAEDFYLCNGSIGFIFDCINFDKIPDSFDKAKCIMFSEYLENFISLFEHAKDDDLLRRALLTKKDYKELDGFSPSLQLKRYSFLCAAHEWQRYFTNLHSAVRQAGRELLVDFCQAKNQFIDRSREDLLQKIIARFIADNFDDTNDTNWIYHFVNNPEILKYCAEKKVCFGDNDINNIVLLKTIRAIYYQKLIFFTLNNRNI